MNYEPQHEGPEKFDPELAIDDLYDQVFVAQKTIFGLTIALLMHVIGTFLIVRKIKRG